MRFLESMSDAILNRSPEELIGALLIVAVTAIVMAGLYALGRTKWSPSPTFVGGLALAAGALCMAVGAGYIEYTATHQTYGSAVNPLAFARRPSGGPGRGTLPPPWSFPGAGWSSGFHVVVAADENRDGHLTPDEAARLVRKADTDGDGSVDFRDIDRLIASRFRPPSQSSGSTAAGPNDRGGGDGPHDTGGGAESSDDEKSSGNSDE
ncbi:MAG: hypothetical protein P4L84_01655 [Isosphaeraceae bacterium]|nr:hypothetical protein [Isosphaeraceae bacterium]